MPKPNIVADVVQKTAEAVKEMLKAQGIDSPEAMKKTILHLIETELGSDLKGLQGAIAQSILQQVPKAGLFSPDQAKAYNPEIGLASLSAEKLDRLKQQMLFSIYGPSVRRGIDATLSLSGRAPIFKDATQQDLEIQTGASGGFLVPTEFHAEVLRRLVKISTFRSEARFLSGVGMKGEIPRETGTVTITYEGENATIDTTDFALGSIQYSLSKRTALTRLSRELYLFSALDVLTLLATMFAEQDQLKDDNVFMNGSGSGMPMGLRVERTGMNTVAQAGANLDWTDLVLAKHKLPIQYRNEGGVWIMTNNTISLVARLKDDVNRPLFVDRGPAGLAGPNVPPMTVGFLLGYPVMEDNYIPETLGAGSNQTEIFFTNLKRGYIGFDAGTAETETSTQEGTSFEKNKVAVRMLRYDDGKPAIPEATVIMTGVK